MKKTIAKLWFLAALATLSPACRPANAGTSIQNSPARSNGSGAITSLTGPITASGPGAAAATVDGTLMAAAINPATSLLQGAMSAADKALMPADVVTTLGAAGNNINVTSLDGDNDGDYWLDFGYTTGGGPGDIYIRVNGATTNENGLVTYNNGTIGSQFTQWEIDSNPATHNQFGFAYITSKSGRKRFAYWVMFDQATDGSTRTVKSGAGMWNDTATDITSLGIFGTGGTPANVFASGSFLRIRKLKKAN